MDRNANDRAHAEAIYGNRTIVVKGTVQTILFELVTIGSREDFDRSDTGGIRSPNILCFDLSTEEAATLHKGKEILIAGQVELGNSGGIWLYKCKLR